MQLSAAGNAAGENNVSLTELIQLTNSISATTAEKIGGIEYYLIEQEGSAYTPLETAEKCLAAFRKVRPA